MISGKSAFVAAVFIVLGSFMQPSAFCFSGTMAVRDTVSSSAFADKYIRTELYFGLARKGRQDVTDSEFQSFVDEFVTPRFPDGLTIVEARGQWRENDLSITKERTKVLILLYPKREKQMASRKIDDIREEYKKRFAQSSVLRVDMSKSLVVTF